MAVVGFCFGGLAALQLARSGAPISAAVSIDGSLATSVHAKPGRVRARLLVCHGTQHGFTHTDAKPGAIPGVAYQEQADTLSFAANSDFLTRAFGPTR